MCPGRGLTTGGWRDLPTGRCGADTQKLTSALRRSLTQIAAEIQRDPPAMLQLRIELISTTPALKGRVLQRVTQLERPLAEWIARETGVGADSVEATTAAAALAHGFRAIAERCADHGNTAALEDDINRAIDLLTGGLAKLGQHSA